MTMLALGLFALAPVQGTPAQVPPTQVTASEVWDRLKFEAEGRMRAEATLDNVDSGPGANAGNEIDDRYRGRMRFRIGAKYPLADKLNLAGRISTASDGNDANNPHWDFGDGDGFNGSGVVMDRYYLDWSACEDVHVVVGKQPHAFAMPPIFGDFVWDSDISPSGVSATWKPAASADELSFDARAAAYVATEVGGDEDPKMWGVQGNVSLPIDKIALQGSAALYDWGDNHDTAVAGNQGNSDVTEYFTILDTFVAATIPGGPIDEMKAYLEFIKNVDESDAGVVAGAQLGTSAWKRGNFNTFFLLYALDGDSLFSPVAQDDTPVAGTGLNDGDGDGMSGAVLGGTYFWRDNIALKLWVLTSNAEGADDNPVRVRLDLDFKVK